MKNRNNSLSASIAAFFVVIAYGLLMIYLLRPTPRLERIVWQVFHPKQFHELWRARAGKDQTIDLWFHPDMTRHVHLPGSGCAGPGCDYTKTW